MPINVNQEWTLFLDRDGVINKRLVGDYVKSVDEFEILEGVPEAIGNLSRIFGRIVVVTNQQGIGKGFFSEDDLAAIHAEFLRALIPQNGRIDKIYVSPHLAASNHETRKPKIGMALLAKADFPEIDFRKSIMVGDSISDMEFGRTAGMVTAFISEENVTNTLIDYQFPSLASFAQALCGHVSKA